MKPTWVIQESIVGIYDVLNGQVKVSPTQRCRCIRRSWVRDLRLGTGQGCQTAICLEIQKVFPFLLTGAHGWVASLRLTLPFKSLPVVVETQDAAISLIKPYRFISPRISWISRLSWERYSLATCENKSSPTSSSLI